MSTDIVRVASKVRAFRADHPITEFGIWTDFREDEVDGVARVVGRCRVVHLASGAVAAVAYGTRALRAPLPGKQGHQDTRDPDRAMTQATGRALGLLGYADGESLEGDTDEPDSSGVTEAVTVTRVERDMTKAAAKKWLVQEFLGKGYSQDEAKTDAQKVWDETGLERGQPWTAEKLRDALDGWLSSAEPFGDDPPPGVDPATGEVSA